MKKSKRRKYIKIAVICGGIVLIAIVLFPKQLMNLIGNKMEAPSVLTSEIRTAEIHISNEQLHYSGEGSINLMQGVTAVDSNGEDVADFVQTSILPGIDQNHKTIEYMITLDGNTQKAARELILENYESPQIEVNSTMEIQASDLNRLVSILSDSGKLKAYDGYGNDIAELVNFQYERATGQTDQYIFTFSLYNQFGDYAQADSVVKIQGEIEGPKIELTQTYVKVERNSAFTPYSYITSATDSKDGDIMDLVEVSNTVDTSVSGQYVVTYVAVNRSGERSEPAKLVVYVE